MEILNQIDTSQVLDAMKEQLKNTGLEKQYASIVREMPSLDQANDFIKGHSHDVQFFWNYWPLYYITWPIGIPLDVLFWPFWLLQSPFEFIWNLIPHFIELLVFSVLLILGSAVGLIVGTVLLAFWLVAIIPVVGFWAGVQFVLGPLIALLGSPFFIILGGPFLLAFSAYKFSVMMLVIGVYLIFNNIFQKI